MLNEKGSVFGTKWKEMGGYQYGHIVEGGGQNTIEWKRGLSEKAIPSKHKHKIINKPES